MPTQDGFLYIWVIINDKKHCLLFFILVLFYLQSNVLVVKQYTHNIKN